MDNTAPMTKWEQRVVGDQRAKSIYATRRKIDRLLEDRRLARELGRVVG